MHDAYDEVAILKKLPLPIESVASFVTKGSSSANLLLGTKVGHLLLYEIELRAGGDAASSAVGPGSGSGVSVRLLQSVKNFSKKPIVQIAVVPQYQILLCLTGTPENVLSVHDMAKTRFPSLSVLEKTRGATLFTLNIKEETSQTGITSVLVFLCVAVKKKLQLYYWKNREFHVLREDLCLPEVPKTMVWSGDSIFVGMRGAWKEYVKLSLTDGSCVELFPVGSDGEAKLVSMAPGRIGLMRDKKLVMLKSDVVFKPDNSSEGLGNAGQQPTLEGSITWTESPVVMEYDGPYLIGILPAGKVEIQTVDPKLLIQTLTIACDASSQKPRLVSQCQLGLVFLASNYDVWALRAQPFNDQIAQLLRQKQFELALKLSEYGTYPDGEREKLVQYIRTLYAFDLFCQQRFQEAMDIFLALDIDPSHVIGLFPDLLPSGFQNQLNYPEKVPELRGHALESGLLALKDCLVEVRNRLKNNNNLSPKPIAEGSRTIGSKDKLLQIIDTTLVKCFLQTTDALVMPFLRLADNRCHLDETERALTKYGKLPELVILYKVKGQHRKALHLLQRQAHRPESALAGTERTVSYLQHLGVENLDLIFEFSSWVLQEFPDQGLKIFTDDLPEIEALPRPRVMAHIGGKAPELLLPYLEHVIFEWKDENHALHDALAERYQAAIQTLSQQPGSGDKLNETRKKLKQFLEFSSSFAPERVLMRLPPEGFHKERAILYEKMGKHDRALAVYVYLLEDLPGAKAYCQRVAKKGGQVAAGEAFLSLLTLMISPPNASVLGVHASKFEKGGEGAFCADVGLENAFQLLEEHPTAMDPCKVMKLLPPTVPLGKLYSFFKSNLYQLSRTRKELQLLKGLHYSQLLQVHVQRMEIQSQKIVLTDLRTCPGCRKRFLNHCAFAHYPNGDLVHYSCMEKYETLKL